VSLVSVLPINEREVGGDGVVTMAFLLRDPPCCKLSCNLLDEVLFVGREVANRLSQDFLKEETLERERKRS